MLRRHIQVGAAAPQGLGEGDPYPVYLGGLGGDALVTAAGATPSDAARRRASRLPAHSAAQVMARRSGATLLVPAAG